jgi:hypothetical protein
MDRALKPERFTTLANTSNAAAEWKHWFCTFENYINSVNCQSASSTAETTTRSTSKSKATSSSKPSPSLKVNPLHCLINCVSSSIFNYFADCTTYESAITILRELYEKRKNPILARFALSSRKQSPTESIDEYIVALQLLSKDCNYTGVTQEEHRQEAIRDAFIAGLHSPTIRQRLLVNTKRN